MKSPSRPTQIIDAGAQFTNGLEEFLNSNRDIYSWGSDYGVVAIIGSQSSGKSTVLNNLFGTEFVVLDSSLRRSQTTQGVWVQRDRYEPVIVLDMEGSDSAQRWDSQTFEKYITVFGLSLADHLIINIWTNEVGRFNASQYGVLQTSMELNLRLWKQEQCKGITFILRDFQGKENLDFITTTIKKDLAKIWQDTKKSSGMQHLTFEHLFKVGVVTLPNLIYEPTQFTAQVRDVRNYLMSELKTHQAANRNIKVRRTPVDGLPLLAAAIWKTITLQQDLDLPNTRRIVSQIRTDQISRQVLLRFKQLTEQYNLQEPQEYKGRVKSALMDGLAYFDDITSHYDQSSVAQRRAELYQHILELIYPSVSLFIQHFRNQLQAALQDELLLLARSSNDSKPQLMNVKQKVILQFQNYLDGFQEFLPQQNIIETRRLYENHINLYIDSYKEQLYDSFIKDLIQEFNQALSIIVEKEFKAFKGNILANISEQALIAAQSLEQKLITFRNTYNLRPTQLNFRSGCQTQVSLIVNGFLPQVNTYAIAKFKDLFTRQQSGLYRDWKQYSSEQIQLMYQEAKNSVFNTLSQLQTKGDLGLSIQAFNAISTKLNDEIEHEYEEVLRKKSYDDSNRVAVTYWVILLFFIYDDILRWLQSPIFIVIAIAACAAWQQGYGYIFKNAFSMINSVIGKVTNQIKDRIK